MLKKDIEYSIKTVGDTPYHIASYNQHRVAVEGHNKHISKATKDYLKGCLEDVVLLRETMGKRY